VTTYTRQQELDSLLEELSYEITAARSCGVSDAERMRAIVRRIRDIASNLDALAGSIVAEEQARS
jgi:hypothetical protein